MQLKLIHNGTIINEGKRFEGYIIIEGERIKTIGDGPYREGEGLPSFKDYEWVIDARKGYIIPGIIDDQVHFREPGLTYKGDIHSESRAGVAGGVTSFMEMPNTKPATVTLEALEEKFAIAEKSAMANYSFYIGATNDNASVLSRINPKEVCSVKVFMGSSTGNMLVDNENTLNRIFAESPILVAVHCEEETIVRNNLKLYKERYSDNITPSMHPLIRSAEACYASSAKAAALAHRYGTHLHILHVSTAKELELFEQKPLQEKTVTCEVCVHHLWFSDNDYLTKGNFIKWNPAVKTLEDRNGIREGVLNGSVDVIATDHAPHTLEEKSRKYSEAPSGGPLLQHSLTAMIEMSKQGIFSMEKIVEKMAHAPALLYNVQDRGFIREGYYADIAVIDNDARWWVTKDNILYKCGWAPFEGTEFSSRVSHTVINGTVAYDNGTFNEQYRGKALAFNR